VHASQLRPASSAAFLPLIKSSFSGVFDVAVITSGGGGDGSVLIASFD